MVTKIAKVVLIGSALAPVGLCYAAVGYLENWEAEFSVKSLSTIFLGGSLAFIFIAFITLHLAQKYIQPLDLKIDSVETADSENLSFMLLYLLPIFQANISELNWHVLGIAVAIYALVIWTGYGFHFNPVLSFLGYHYYKAGTPEGVTYVLISRRQFRNTREKLQVKQLTEYIVLDVGR